MTEFEIIQEEIESIKQKYLRSAMDIISDHNNENKTKTDYKRRQIYELLQNADDCYSKEIPQISVCMELRDNLLIIQNTGAPFSARGVLSLMHTDTSSKHEGTIGCKGLGFRSVLNWANRVSVYTRDFCVDFSEERAIRYLEYYKQQSHAYGAEELDRLSRTAILTAAEVYNDKTEISKWLSPEYSTAIVLYCDDTYIDEIRNQLINLKFEELLFLQHVNTIEIITSEATRKIESIKKNELCIIQESDFISQWRVWSRQGELTQENGETKKYELIIAYNDDAAEREVIRENGVLYSYFKTDIPMSFPFLIHGTFELTSERNSLVKDNLFNKMILDRLIDFIGEIGEGLVYDSDKCDYEALRFLLPSESLGQLDREYNFTSRLKEKIREYKIFPTISEEYISISESPKYSRRRFDEILLPSTCRTLLKHAPDEYIVDYISESSIKFYSDKELVELMNQDAQYYVNNALNAELIALYYETFISAYPYSQVAPKLLTDSKGNLILDENVKIFDNPTQRFDLPEWSNICFINQELEQKLTQRLNLQGRLLTDKLKPFHIVRYEFERVLGELIAQSKADIEKTKSTIAWLYDYWNKNAHNFPSKLTNVEVRIISRDNEIVQASKCYMGNEYGNDIGERITVCLDDAKYIAAPCELALEIYNLEDLKAFLLCIGVKKYPSIEIVKLNYQERADYIRYNSEMYPQVFDKYNNCYKYDELFYQYDKEISVSYIKGIDKIILNVDFTDIICWLLDDRDLYNCVVNKNEVSDLAVMKGRPYRAQSSREVKKYYMRSWLRKVFTEEKWLPTQRGCKSAVDNCTLTTHQLSPIVEVLDVDYNQLIALSGRSRKEIELLFENLGIVEDVVDLAPQKIYEILLGLYTTQAPHTVTKQIYTKLNLKYKAETIGGLINNNPMYEKFKSEGGVLAELNGEYVYLPVGDVYYVDKKIYSEDILKNYPLLVLGKRAGASKIQKMFCVQPIQSTSEIQVEYEEHDLNVAYQKEFQRSLPYIYAKRIAVDSKNKEFYALRSAKIILVKEALSLYKIGEDQQQGMLQDYELIYKDRVAYIKIPMHIRRIDELKESVKFRGAVAEVITTILDVDGDKDAFLIILACKSTKEAEEYFIENGDDDLSTVNLAKAKFSEQIDRKVEFWNAIENALGVEKIDQSQYADLLINFDYNNLNCFSNCACIIKLFKKLGINVEHYNQYAFEIVDLQPYYKEALRQIKQKYREKYFIYSLVRSGRIKTKFDFEVAKQNYDELTLVATNSVDAQLEKIFENSFGISISVLNGTEGNLDELIEKLNADTQYTPPLTPTPTSQSTPKVEVNYDEINAQIASNTNAESKKVGLSALNTTTSKTVGSKKKGGTYDSTTTKTKEENGFIAESKVYHTLRARIGSKGSVVWVSGNGYRANENNGGDDSLGHDIWYSDENGKKHYVEVKGSTSENVEFVLTKNELEFAELHAEEYEIWYVHIVDKQPAIPYELGNLLLLGEEETFFNNSKFAVENSEFRIRATVNEQVEE